MANTHFGSISYCGKLSFFLWLCVWDWDALFVYFHIKHCLRKRVVKKLVVIFFSNSTAFKHIGNGMLAFVESSFHSNKHTYLLRRVDAHRSEANSESNLLIELKLILSETRKVRSVKFSI